MYQLYILLSTCNFPDIMLGTFSVTKWGIFYFVIYITFNFFIILSLLKTLYYSKYFDINKKNCEIIIGNIRANDSYKSIFEQKEFAKFLVTLKERYSLDESQYSMIIFYLGIKEKAVLHQEIKHKYSIKNHMKNDSQSTLSKFSHHYSLLGTKKKTKGGIMEEKDIKDYFILTIACSGELSMKYLKLLLLLMIIFLK